MPLHATPAHAAPTSERRSLLQIVREAFSPVVWVVLVIFCAVGAFTCLVGLRVVRTKWFYSGNYEENYFSGFQPFDVLWFILLFVGLIIVTAALLLLYRFLLKRIPLRRVAVNPAVVFCVSWIIIFVCWVPYFLVNYPGALYADSIVIIKQALGINPLTSHHPIAYVGLIGIFLHLGDALAGSYILGIAFYTAFQMVFMSAVFAYTLSWLAKRRIPLPAIVVVGALFALPSIFPLHAVSMWKDGLYAAFILCLSLLLFDVVCSRGSLLSNPSILFRLAIWGLAVTLIRSNGIYVMILVWAALILLYLFTSNPLRVRWGFALACTASLGAFWVVTGPLSSALEVGVEPVESYGIPLQQVAAVVVYEGEMDGTEREFLNTMLPLDKYKEEYIPCSVDGIKWADDFNAEFFNDHQREFLGVWASLLPKNIGIYAAAYTMESYEYWSFADVGRTFTFNGVNDKYDAPDLGIIETNLLEAWFGKDAKELFPFRFICLQEGAVSWIVLFCGLLLFVAWRGKWASGPQGTPFANSWWLVLLPAFANWLTVLISSPFAALPRYILPAVFLLPVFLLIPWLVRSCAHSAEGEQNTSFQLTQAEGEDKIPRCV